MQHTRLSPSTNHYFCTLYTVNACISVWLLNQWLSERKHLNTTLMGWDKSVYKPGWQRIFVTNSALILAECVCFIWSVSLFPHIVFCFLWINPLLFFLPLLLTTKTPFVSFPPPWSYPPPHQPPSTCFQSWWPPQSVVCLTKLSMAVSHTSTLSLRGETDQSGERRKMMVTVGWTYDWCEHIFAYIFCSVCACMYYKYS